MYVGPKLFDPQVEPPSLPVERQARPRAYWEERTLFLQYQLCIDDHPVLDSGQSFWKF
jgi:hypothetical protein